MRFPIGGAPAIASRHASFWPQSPVRFALSTIGFVGMAALGVGAIAASILATPVLAGFLAAGTIVVVTVALLGFCLGKRIDATAALRELETRQANLKQQQHLVEMEHFGIAQLKALNMESGAEINALKRNAVVE